MFGVLQKVVEWKEQKYRLISHFLTCCCLIVKPFQGIQVANNIRDVERNGKGNVHVLGN